MCSCSSCKHKEHEVSFTQPAYPAVRLLIGGQWRDRPGRPVVNPCTGEVIGIVPHATRSDLEDAVRAAQEGFLVWRAFAPVKRSEILQRAAALLRERIDTIAATMVQEQGKLVSDAKSEVIRGATMLEWDAQEARRTYGRVIPSEPGMRHTVLREPIGVVAAFSPWNAPLGSPVRKVSPALAAGCAVILKAAEETPASAIHLAQALMDAGLPDGVLNLVFGNPSDVSEFLIPHPIVRLVAFTGSTAVGKRLTAMAGAHMKPVVMELGGHGPVIVCDDADPLKVAALAVAAKARNAGQLCVAATRFYVADAVYDAFSAEMVRLANELRVGDPFDPATQMGPMANPRRVEAIGSLIEEAVTRGAKVLTGGTTMNGPGYFLPLTVLGDVPDDARAMHEEPFGPLALLQRFSTVDEAIAKSNALAAGLNAYAFTDSARLIDRFMLEIETGYLSINHFGSSVAETPFGGVKDSGFSREGGSEGLEHYTIAKTVSQRTRY
jgi:succinate-semialdehyde dehydrogenase/glutarate-semialdehyde dehydrogenase